jgi:hypothetical protein
MVACYVPAEPRPGDGPVPDRRMGRPRREHCCARASAAEPLPLWSCGAGFVPTPDSTYRSFTCVPTEPGSGNVTGPSEPWHALPPSDGGAMDQLSTSVTPWRYPTASCRHRTARRKAPRAVS